MSVRLVSASSLSTKVFNPPAGGVDALPIDILIVAGGGGGCAAGGGAGGVIYRNQIYIPKNRQYTVVVGSGGTTAELLHASLAAGPTLGGNSKFYDTLDSNGIKLIAIGGGVGSRYGPQNLYGRPSDGGSGGGSATSATTAIYYAIPGHGNGIEGQGNRGGYNSGTTGNRHGGGGGAGGQGQDLASVTQGGAGGVGLLTDISGTSTYYGGGGGGGAYNGVTAATYGGAGGAGGGGGGSGYTAGGTGGSNGGVTPPNNSNGGAGGANSGGGGGGGFKPTAGYTGGNGGSGIVIVRYADTYDAATTSGTVTYTNSGGYRIYQYTGSGTFTI